MTGVIPPIPPEEWSHVARLDPEPYRDPATRKLNRDRRNHRIISNIAALLEEPRRWTRELPCELVWRHDAGIVVQLRRMPMDALLEPNTISKIVAVWMDGMTPFRCSFENPATVPTFYQAMLTMEAEPTIQKVGVIAALCAERT